MLREGGFRLTKFLSNRREVLQAIPVEERANPTRDLALDRLPIDRTLGLGWDAESDVFCFKTICTDRRITKRGILSTISSLFDPLGFLAPFVLPVKVLIQDLWLDKVGWDDAIQDHHSAVWRRWIESLPLLTAIRIPRCYRHPKMDGCAAQLHLFSDASEFAYSACAYLRIVSEDGSTHCSFVMGKCRNVPLKRPTIPRLELMGGLMAVRLCNMVKTELDWTVESVTFWTDSVTVIQYIRNETRRFHRFVATRLEEIHEHTTPNQWRHVPGALNPADDGSRGLPIQAFQPECRWWTGPGFLWQLEDLWPQRKVDEVPVDDEEVIKPRSQQLMTVTVGSTLEELLKRFSSWSKLQVCISWLVRFVQYLQSKAEPETPYLKDVSLADMRASSGLIVKLVQRQCLQDNYTALESGKQVKASSRLANLSPILLGGVIRVGGRLQHTPISPEAIHPMIVPNEHSVAVLIIRHYHQTLGHVGREHVLAAVRQRYWIHNARVLTRQVLRRCIDCRKRHEASMRQFMGELPRARLTPYEPPFIYTGLDFFGPFHVKRGRSTEKVYGCIFVCLSGFPLFTSQRAVRDQAAILLC